MRVLAFNGSPRKGGNTSILLGHLFETLEGEGIKCEEIQTGYDLKGCLACGACRAGLNRCVQDDDPLNEWVESMKTADAIVLASPTYFGTVTGSMKNFIDRAGYVCRPQNLLYRKVGAPLVTARRGGAIQTYNTLLNFFGLAQMVVPMSSYWNFAYGSAAGEVLQDQEGLDTARNLGLNMAWLLQRLQAGK